MRIDLVQLDFLIDIHLPPVWTAPVPGGYGHWSCPNCHNEERGITFALVFPEDKERLVGYCRLCGYQHTFAQPYGHAPETSYPEVEAKSRALEHAIRDDRFYVLSHGKWVHLASARTGFPRNCPTGHADRVCAANCETCPYYTRVRGRYACAHVDFQQAPGDHFCRRCGRELPPYHQARGWAYCHIDQCLNPD